MEGSIEVQSEEGQGTIFTILLPISQNEKIATEPLISFKTDSLLEKKTVETKSDDMESLTSSDRPQLLIIEDNRDVAAYIQTCLQDDYTIHLASDGKVGLEKTFELIPDLIISDVMMPEKDGYEVTRILKNDERTSHIPVILLTAKASIKDKLTGLKKGADAYLIKPFHKEELLIRMKKMLELRQALQKRYANYSPPILSPAADKPPSLEEVFLQKLYQLVEDEIGNPNLNVAMISEALYLSQAQTYRKLKALTGKTPALFIRSIRLKKAKELLESGQFNVSQVAYNLGFSDPNYFSRVFSKEFGESPAFFINN